MRVGANLVSVQVTVPSGFVAMQAGYHATDCTGVYRAPVPAWGVLRPPPLFFDERKCLINKKYEHDKYDVEHWRYVEIGSVMYCLVASYAHG